MFSPWYHRSPGPRHRDTGWAWVVLVYAYVIGVMAGGLIFSYGVILRTLMGELDSNRQLAALVGSLALGLSLMLSVVTSKLCEALTCRITNGLGILCIISGLITSSLAQSIYPLYLTYSMLIGFGASCTYCAAFITVRQYFHKHYALATGVTAAGAGTGVLSFGPLIQLVIESLGWRNAFRVISCMFVVLLLFTFILDPNVEQFAGGQVSSRGHRSRENNNEVPASKLRTSCAEMFDLSVWKFPEYTIAVVAISISSFGHYTPNIHLVKYAEEQGLTARDGSLLLIFVGISTILSRIIAGRLLDVTPLKPRPVNQIAASLSGVSTMLLPFASTFTHLVMFAVAYGLADGAFRVTLYLLFMSTVDHARQASAFGQGNMVSSPTSVIGPVIAGIMADRSGSYVSAFYMSGATTLAGSLIFLLHFFRFGSTKASTHRQEVICNPYHAGDDLDLHEGPKS